MTSINSSNNSTPKAYASAGFSGLASGLDTESMVKQMLAGTQNKIDKQTALKQQTQWKQDAFRDIISSFHSFQNKFFNYLSPKTNLLSASFYNTKAVSSSSSSVKVSALGDVLNNKLTINSVTSLATARKETGSQEISGGIVLDVDNLAYTESLEGLSVSVTLDGITKNVALSRDAVGSYKAGDKEAILQNLQNGLDKAFGNGITVDVSTGAVSVGSGRQVSLTGGTDVQKILGINGSVSNKISLTRSLGDLNLNTKLAGSSFKFSINGENFEFDKSNTMNDIIRQINSSKAGVRVSYSGLTDKFSIESTTTGAGINFEMSQTEGNLLTTMFGVSSGSKVTSKTLYTSSINSENASSLNDVKSGSFNVMVNGVSHSISVDTIAEGNDPYTLETLVENLNTKLNEKFGNQYGENTFAFSIDVDTQKVSLSVSSSHDVKIDASSGTLGEQLGFIDDASNTVSGSSTLASVGLTGLLQIGTNVVDLSDFNSIDALVAAHPNTFSFDSAKKTLSIIDSGQVTITTNPANSFLVRLFDNENIVINSPEVGRQLDSAGNNAILKVNGQEIQRNTNDFNIDGYQISLQSTMIDENNPITLTAENNTEQILDGIVQFVNEYNTMIEKINGLTSAKAVYKDYPPLTDEQKKEMTDKEIELWEEKSKEGLLSGDAQLNGLLSQMRSLMYTKPEGSMLALYDIGITTSNNYLDKGKLLIDEEKLKAAINQDPAQINLLFTDKNGGLAVSFNKLVEQTAKSSVSSPGTLVQLAGVKNTATDKKNSLFTRMEDIDKTITRLKARYEMEKSRYWKQFTSLEKVINQTNSQSSWLMNMFGQ